MKQHIRQVCIHLRITDNSMLYTNRKMKRWWSIYIDFKNKQVCNYGYGDGRSHYSQFCKRLVPVKGEAVTDIL